MKAMLVYRLTSLVACALLLPAAARAQTTSFTATGWLDGVPVPGLLATNSLGQVVLRGNVHTIRVQSADARMTGQIFAHMDGSFNADGTVNVQGPVSAQVGKWDAAGTNFNPGAGVWVGNYRGLLQTNYSLQLGFAGYGVGGAIEGLRLEGTLTRTNAAGVFDPTVPYLLTGTIAPPPVSTTLLSEDFNSGFQGWVRIDPGYGIFNLFPTNQAFGLRADFRGHSPGPLGNFVHAHPSAGNYNWSLADGQTLECQADLISVSEDSTNYPYLLVGGDQGLYYLALSHNGAGLFKSLGPSVTCFWLDNTVQFPLSNIVLYLALTRDHANLLITTRVLDKAHPSAVLFERTFLDTPAGESTLTTAQYRALTGATTLVLVPDPGPPVFAVSGWYGASGGGGVGVNQDSDSNQPPVEAIWDNFSLRLHDVAPLNIAPAVQLTWPVSADVNYAIEIAPTIQGPWLPVQELNVLGVQKQTVPLSGPAQFFRLIQVP